MHARAATRFRRCRASAHDHGHPERDAGFLFRTAGNSDRPEAALEQAKAMVAAGADIIDVG